MLQQSCSTSPPHSMQTLEPKANTGNTGKLMSMETKPRRSQGSLPTSLYNNHVSTTSPVMSFKSSLTLTTPKERKEGWQYYLEFAFLCVEDDKSILNYQLNSHRSAECLRSVSMQAGCLLGWLLTRPTSPLECSHLLMEAVISLGS